MDHEVYSQKLIWYSTTTLTSNPFVIYSSIEQSFYGGLYINRSNRLIHIQIWIVTNISTQISNCLILTQISLQSQNIIDIAGLIFCIICWMIRQLSKSRIIYLLIISHPTHWNMSRARFIIYPMINFITVS